MPTTLDCYIMRNIFGSDRMRAVFDSSRLLQGWLDVWAALAEAEAEAGLIPMEAAAKIRSVARAENFDIVAIGKGVETGRHSLMPSIRALSEAAGDAGKYVHWGTTTQDIIDTGVVLQIRDALDIIETEVRTQIGFLLELAKRYRDTAMAGRTHWQHAVPITFGMKVALWIDELSRHVERLQRCREQVLVCQLSGAAGTFASLGEYAETVQQAFSRRVGLPLPSAPWYNVRDRFGEMVSTLGMIAATFERICLDTGLLSATEIGEVSEPQTKTQVGSSTMPQKVNPINGERAIANFHMVRGLVPVMQGIMVVPHERDMSTTATEWLLLPQVFILLDGGLSLAHRILVDLQVYPENLARNLRITGGGIVAEAVMFGLAQHLGRTRAHELTIEMAGKSHAEHRPLFDVLKENAEIRRYLDEDELRELVDPENHLGLAGKVVDGVVARAEALAVKVAK
ncbi:3-carboxy-cis,cis-muconate cycloisomerase [Xaviernesmea oryzae]|uniref:3-carboxy-cis,cis-muconate cycloisomerase n=1 Tax=Xaviernesmea oryzae TaxID=464029 RepID=A0A1X7DUU6_9HYPH|nr:adenylosuccinate lyase [Xaviernesmea oryzae]SMF22214.1 3-carboxy-cis,cis-muconate cycloisomerase [Xaviernesmea oryzae]